jgi:hypothetical protein
MRNTILLALFIVTFSACSKDDDNSSSNATVDCGVAPFRSGTIYKYSSSNGEIGTTIFGIDTVISGRKYYKQTNSQIAEQQTNLFHVASNGDIYWSAILPNGLSQYNMINHIILKMNQPTETTWQYEWNLANSQLVIYYHKIISTTETLLFNNKEYNKGIIVETIIKRFQNNNLITTIKQIQTYFCGLGNSRTALFNPINTNNPQIINITDYEY